MEGVLPKLVYSVLPLDLSGLILRELWIAWFGARINSGRLEVVSQAQAGDDVEAGQASRSGS
jgi:hypothetical protein